MNEVAGIDVVARLDAFRAELAKIPDIGGKEARALTAQLSREIKRSEKASRDAAKAAREHAGATRDAANASKAFGDKAGAAGSIASKLGQALGVLSPELGALGQTFADGADGAEALAQTSEATGAGLGRVLAIAGPLALAVGALTLAYQANVRESERVVELREFEHETARSLLASERDLISAQRELALATGQLSEREAALSEVRETARGAVLDYAEAQREQRAELRATIADTEWWAKQQENLARGLAVVSGLLSGESLATVQRWAEEIEGAFDAVTGWQASIETAEGKLDSLSEAEVKHAARQKEIRRLGEQTKEAAGDEKDLTKELLDQAEAAQKVADAFAERLAAIEAAADEAQAIVARSSDWARGEVEELGIARDAQVDAYVDAAKRGALSEAEIAKGKAAIVAQYEAHITDTIETEAERRAEAAEEASDRASAAAERAAEEARTAAMSVLSSVETAFSAVVDLLDLGYQHQVETLYKLQAELEDGQERLTDREKAELEERVAAQKQAALDAWYAEQATEIALGFLQLAAAELQALASAPPPYNYINAAAVGVAGAISMASLATASPPTFHEGHVGRLGLAPDEYMARLKSGESVLTDRATEALGDDAIRSLNTGGGLAPSGPTHAYLVYRHQDWSRVWQDAARIQGPFRDAVTRGDRVGLRGRGRR